MIKNLVLKSGSEILENVSYGTGGKTNGSQRSSMSLRNGENTFMIELTDIYGYTYTDSKTLIIGNGITTTDGSSIKNPTISTINPKNSDTRISLFSGDSFNLRFSISVGTEAREVSVFLDGVSIQNASA